MFFYEYNFVQGVFFLQMLRARKQAISWRQCKDCSKTWKKYKIKCVFLLGLVIAVLGAFSL